MFNWIMEVVFMAGGEVIYLGGERLVEGDAFSLQLPGLFFKSQLSSSLSLLYLPTLLFVFPLLHNPPLSSYDGGSVVNMFFNE